jgi:ParB-like chromosome segregation protein Spo0J
VATKDDATASHLFTASLGASTNQMPSLGPVKSLRDSAHTDGSLRSGEPELVEIAQLVPAGSPRSDREDNAHVERLVEAEWPLPPILVHRPTMRIIDGFHRVCAAKRKGLQEILAIFFDGSLESAFIVAVEANVTHGLPLSIGDRRAAAARILQTHSDWSDRAIAASTGLSDKTVSAIRCATAENPQLNKRVGKDGRVRPLNAGVGRQRAAQLLSSHPDASLREIAKAAGISPGTVRDVRERLKAGEGVVPIARCQNRIAARGGGRKQSAASATNTDVPADVKPVLLSLSRDPALAMSEAGRKLLHWLHFHSVSSSDLTRIAESVPDHCVDRLVELANRCATNWAWIAADLSKRTQDMHMAGAAPSANRRNIRPTQRTA